MKIHFYCLGLLAALFCLSASAAELNRASIQQRLAKADKGHPAQLRRKDLTGLDLSALDFTLAQDQSHHLHK